MTGIGVSMGVAVAMPLAMTRAWLAAMGMAMAAAAVRVAMALLAPMRMTQDRVDQDVRNKTDDSRDAHHLAIDGLWGHEAAVGLHDQEGGHEPDDGDARQRAQSIRQIGRAHV